MALHPPLLESLQKNPSRGSHRTSDVDEHDFFTFRPRPVNHNSYRGTWEYKTSDINMKNTTSLIQTWATQLLWYKHEQLNLSDIHMNNTTAWSAQHMGVAWGAFPFNNIDVPVTHSVQAEHCFCPLRPSLKVPSGHFEHNVLIVAEQSLWTLYPVWKNVKICCLPEDLVEEIVQNYFGQQLDNSWVNGLLPPGHARQQTCPALYSSPGHDGDAVLATP